MEQLREAQRREEEAQQIVADARKEVEKLQKDVIGGIADLEAEIETNLKLIESWQKAFSSQHPDRSTLSSNASDEGDTLDFLVEDYREFKKYRGTELNNVLSSVWQLYDSQGYPSVNYRIVPNGQGFSIVTTGQRMLDNGKDKTLNPQVFHQIFKEALEAQEKCHNEFAKFAYKGDAERLWDESEELLTALRKYRTQLDKGPVNGPIEYQKLVDVWELREKHHKLAVAVGEFRKWLQEEFDELIAKMMRAAQGDAAVRAATDGPVDGGFEEVFRMWMTLRKELDFRVKDESLQKQLDEFAGPVDTGFRGLMSKGVELQFAQRHAEAARRPLDHKKFLDMLIDDLEEKYIELLEGTRAHTANVDNYIKRVATALDDDFNTQFYFPAMRGARQASRYWDVTFGQVETTSVLANNRAFAKVEPQATMEFDLPERDILLNEAMNGAMAAVDDFGALVNDPTFLALSRLNAGGSTASPAAGSTGDFNPVRSVLPGLPTSDAEALMTQAGTAEPKFGSALEGLIPDPAIYKFETGTGFEIRPVIQPDGQAVVFHFNYMYTTNVREPVRADEKHLGRVKRHFVDTDVQLSNYELREVSRYQVALKASRTARGVPLLEDIPGLGVLFRPLPQQESSLQENLIYAQATIFPTMFDLMGLRWAPAVSDLDPLRLSNEEFIVRNRHRALENRVYDYSSAQVDEFLRIPDADRRPDLYRSQETLPAMHPNGYHGPGLDLEDSQMEEGYQPKRTHPPQKFIPGQSAEGAPFLHGRSDEMPDGTFIDRYPIEVIEEDSGPSLKVEE